LTHAKAKDNCYTDYSFHLLVGNPTEKALSEFATLRKEGISSLKIYMTYAALKLHDGQILDVLLEARKQSITTMIHAENNEIIEWMTAQLEKRKLYAPKYHATSHPALAENEATYRAICLSEFIDAPILIVHVSSPVSVATIRAAQGRGLPIYAETCPQYFTLTKKDLDKPVSVPFDCTIRDKQFDQLRKGFRRRKMRLLPTPPRRPRRPRRHLARPI
jgi:dihydropyrimidinase